MRQDAGRIEGEASAIGRFPNGDLREVFLRHVRLWNAVEGLPAVHAEPLRDGQRVQIRTVASAQRGIERLITELGGRVVNDSPAPDDATAVSGADACP
jgi:hypothetical protein